LKNTIKLNKNKSGQLITLAVDNKDKTLVFALDQEINSLDLDSLTNKVKQT